MPELIKEKLQTEEYIQVRNEIVSRERTITQLFAVALIASVSILSAVSTFFFKLSPDEVAGVSSEYAYAFLGPLIVIIPILFVLVSHCRDIHRSGTYLHVFFEEANLGPLWETRLAKFREKNKGESLDAIPLTFWAISLFAVVFFFLALYKVSGFAWNLTWVLAVILVIAALVVLGIGHALFSYASISIRDKYYKSWREIHQQTAKD